MQGIAFRFLSIVTASIWLWAACGGSTEQTPTADAGDAGGGMVDLSPDVMPAVVTFADQNLEACVRAALDKTQGELSPADLQALTLLECQDHGIKSLDGLEFAEKLTDLALWENEIVDLAPLAKLVELTALQLGANKVVDLTPLAELKRLQRLGLSQNAITDLSPLKGLVDLRWLNLDSNAIAAGQTEHLAGLTKLAWLTLEHNAIAAADLGKLTPLTQAGCDLYKRLPDQPALRDLPREFPGDTLALRGGKLLPTVGQDGAVHFTYAVGERRIPALAVFPGRILLAGDRLRWERPGGAVIEIGRTAGAAAVLCTGEHAAACELAVGIKGGAAAPAKPAGDPVITLTLSPRQSGARWTFIDAVDPRTKNDELVQFAIASPNQADAGSCLFMSNTGAMEILLNQHTPAKEVSYDGPTDLSERYLMNASSYVPKEAMPYTITDVIYTFNQFKGALLNKDYRFTAGYVKKLTNGELVKSSKEEGGQFSCQYNWIDELPTGWQSMVTATPPVERTAVFNDPVRTNESVWHLALMNDDVIERIKHELRTKNAPVIVIYNHFLYWHAAIVVGYDDNEPTGNCPMVQQSMDYFTQKGSTSYTTKIKDHMAKNGGCASKGVFLVRDSIYDGEEEEPDYLYSSQYTYKAKYSKRIIKHEYDWVKYLANHAYTIHRR